jgi:hypothetical protein
MHCQRLPNFLNSLHRPLTICLFPCKSLVEDENRIAFPSMPNQNWLLISRVQEVAIYCRH